MKKVKKSTKRGFSLIEVFTAVLIILIFASFITLKMDSNRQTAKKEAEKLADYIHELMREADRSHVSFSIVYKEGLIQISKSDKDGKNTFTDLPVASGFTVSFNNSSEPIQYNISNNAFDTPRTFTVTSEKDNTPYYIVIRNGRIRTSATPPSN